MRHCYVPRLFSQIRLSFWVHFIVWMLCIDPYRFRILSIHFSWGGFILIKFDRRVVYERAREKKEKKYIETVLVVHQSSSNTHFIYLFKFHFSMCNSIRAICTFVQWPMSNISNTIFVYIFERSKRTAIVRTVSFLFHKRWWIVEPFDSIKVIERMSQ